MGQHRYTPENQEGPTGEGASIPARLCPRWDYRECGQVADPIQNRPVNIEAAEGVTSKPRSEV